MPRRRQGFTMIELLVSMALIIFIMAILSEAFVCCAKAFRDFKATGDMAERLRSTASLLAGDLKADHFEGKKRLSQPDFWLNGPPLEGFFRIYQGSNINNHLEGLDLEGIPSYLVSDHILHFTIKLRGNSRDDFLLASVPSGTLPGDASWSGNADRRFQDVPSTFSSQWAEVAWFLAPTIDVQNSGQENTTGNPPTPLYGLYRRQRVAVPERLARKVWLTNPSGYSDVSVFFTNVPGPIGNGANYYPASPSDLTAPWRRFGMSPYTGANPPNANDPTLAGLIAPGYQNSYPTLASTDPIRQGADLMLTDVISFEVRGLYSSSTNPNVMLGGNFIDVNNNVLRPYRTHRPGNRPNNPVYTGNGGPMVFDTWSQLAEGPPGGAATAIYGLYPQNSSTPYWKTPGTAASIPMYVNQGNSQDFLLLRALQVTVRVWDLNTSQTRQITVIQDM